MCWLGNEIPRSKWQPSCTAWLCKVGAPHQEMYSHIFLTHRGCCIINKKCRQNFLRENDFQRNYLFFPSFSCESVGFLEDSSAQFFLSFAEQNEAQIYPGAVSSGHTVRPQGFVSPSRLLIKVSSFIGIWFYWGTERSCGPSWLILQKNNPSLAVLWGLDSVHSIQLGQGQVWLMCLPPLQPWCHALTPSKSFLLKQHQIHLWKTILSPSLLY